MNHMFWIGALLGIVFGVVATMVFACCAISSRISREEEKAILKREVERNN